MIIVLSHDLKTIAISTPSTGALKFRAVRVLLAHNNLIHALMLPEPTKRSLSESS